MGVTGARQVLGRATELHQYCCFVNHFSRLAAVGEDPLAFADYLHSLGTIHYRMDKLEDAEEEFSRVLEIRKAMLDKDHEDIGRTLTDYARVVKKLGQAENAEAIYKKAKEILRRNS